MKNLVIKGLLSLFISALSISLATAQALTDDCLNIQYPIKYKLKNGTTKTVKNDNQLDDLSLDAEGHIVFPITVKLKEGKKKVIKTEKQFDAIYEDCYGMENLMGGEEMMGEEMIGEANLLADVSVHYPVKFKSKKKAKNDKEFNKALLEQEQIVYPITVTIKKTKKKRVIKNDQELDKLLNEFMSF